MSWRRIPGEDADLVEELVRDDDRRVLGGIMRFYEDGPTYAHCLGMRLGAFATDAAARLAVEMARMAFQRPGGKI